MHFQLTNMSPLISERKQMDDRVDIYGHGGHTSWDTGHAIGLAELSEILPINSILEILPINSIDF